MTVLCPCWPGNGSTWRGFDDDPGRCRRSRCSGSPIWWRRGSTASAARRRSRSSAPASAAWSASRSPCGIPSGAAGSSPSRPGCGPTAGARRRATSSASWCATAIRNGDVATGMSRARQLGMLTYRGRDELDTRFGKLEPGLERPPVAEYLEHHGRRFAERFPVRTFLLLSEAIDRGAIGTDAASRRAAARAGHRRHDRRRRARRHAVSVGAAGRAAPRAAGGRRAVVAVEARLAVRPRRVPRRSGSARRAAARRRRVRRRAARSARGRASRASASSRCASCASAWSAAAPSAAACSR